MTDTEKLKVTLELLARAIDKLPNKELRVSDEACIFGVDPRLRIVREYDIRTNESVFVAVLLGDLLPEGEEG